MSAESKLQNAAIKYAKSAGYMVKRNYMGPGVATGWPDVEFFSPTGNMFFIEFKAPGGKPSTRQRYVMGKLAAREHKVFICDDLDDAKRIIDAYR